MLKMNWLTEFPQLGRSDLTMIKKTLDNAYREFTRNYGEGVELFFEPILRCKLCILEFGFCQACFAVCFFSKWCQKCSCTFWSKVVSPVHVKIRKLKFANRYGKELKKYYQKNCPNPTESLWSVPKNYIRKNMIFVSKARKILLLQKWILKAS